MSTCIQIVEGVVPGINRLALKGHMEQFGQVDLVHMGNRQNPEEEPPKVRFSTPEAAQRALEAINGGQVVIDGMLLKAQYMQGKGRGRGAPPTATERNLEVTSRDLFLERERARNRAGGGGGGGGKERSRSRDRSRDRRRRRRSSDSSRSKRRRRSASKSRGRRR
ncbi:APUM3 [Symbiodinium pilosum]|uniref:APUM3 protein n=1 Tax=Symbiodinium pilosum TaxID=2952 RepID=A0A812U501_SYMPI|nr:APUM3 [Symbiodinium pilosum]